LMVAPYASLQLQARGGNWRIIGGYLA
jgi:hypothetical protein